jgi:type IX secretion system PorP/SprF family membrane protein
MKQTIFLLLLIAGKFGEAQSYHFSQFFSTPLLTNPAHTGFTDGSFRVASNFRSQGSGNGNTFFSAYASADYSLFRNKIVNGHKAGVGIYLMNDHSLAGAMQTSSIGVSTAYNVALDPYGEHSLGLGFQGVFHQRRFDYSKLTFENQFGPNGFDGSLPLGEPMDFNRRQSFDLNAGIMYNILLPDKSFFAGFSAYNLLSHNDNVLAEEFKMPIRLNFQAGARFFVHEYASVYSSLTSIYQNGANQLTLGGAYGYQLTDGDQNELIGGMWYRLKDAVIPYVGYQRDGFQVGLTYDYTVSSLKTAPRLRNAYELTLLYRSKDKRELKTLIPWY